MFERARQHNKAKAHITRNLNRFSKNPNHKFTLDTNIFIILAEHGDTALLESLASCAGFIMTGTNRDELRGLLSSGRSHGTPKRLLQDFLKKSKSKDQSVKHKIDRKDTKPLDRSSSKKACT